MNRTSDSNDSAIQCLTEFGTERVGNGYVGHQSIAKKASVTKIGIVKNLVGNHDMTGGIFLAQRSTCVDPQDVLHTQHFERINIGSVGDSGRAVDVPNTMSWQKGHS